ncbi:hypothetical protein JQC92_05765 [Shewanella sp. 202IG2-18]|uniref:hypothetical protein n=1 Tax=Parashewanella hymeniacidonis TaxID=2807618 RepID=UPI0019608BFD|nr:hypothetical protein [Parashewanella hymeniacidonis]MBM7071546.1 hypothetical protein [Parashewanella hymeniacidonis]
MTQYTASARPAIRPHFQFPTELEKFSKDSNSEFQIGNLKYKVEIKDSTLHIPPINLKEAKQSTSKQTEQLKRFKVELLSSGHLPEDVVANATDESDDILIGVLSLASKDDCIKILTAIIKKRLATDVAEEQSGFVALRTRSASNTSPFSLNAEELPFEQNLLVKIAMNNPENAIAIMDALTSEFESEGKNALLIDAMLRQLRQPETYGCFFTQLPSEHQKKLLEDEGIKTAILKSPIDSLLKLSTEKNDWIRFLDTFGKRCIVADLNSKVTSPELCETICEYVIKHRAYTHSAMELAPSTIKAISLPLSYLSEEQYQHLIFESFQATLQKQITGGSKISSLLPRIPSGIKAQLLQNDSIKSCLKTNVSALTYDYLLQLSDIEEDWKEIINIVGVEPFLTALKTNIEIPKYQKLCEVLITHAKMDELLSSPDSGINAFLALPEQYQTQKTPPNISHFLTAGGGKTHSEQAEMWSQINACPALNAPLLSMAKTKPLELLNHIEQLPGTAPIQLPLILELLSNQEIKEKISCSKSPSASFPLPCQIVSAINDNIADVAKFIKFKVADENLDLASNMLTVINANDGSNELLIAVASEMIKDILCPITHITSILDIANIKLWDAEHIDTFAPLMGGRLSIAPDLVATLTACHFPKSYFLRLMIIPKMLPHLLTNDTDSMQRVYRLMEFFSLDGSSLERGISGSAMQDMMAMAIKNAPQTVPSFIFAYLDLQDHELEGFYLAACKLHPMTTADLRGLVENSQTYLPAKINDTESNTGHHIYKIMMGDYQRGQEFFELLSEEEKSKVAFTIMNNIWQFSPENAQFFLNFKMTNRALLTKFITFSSQGDEKNFVSSAQAPECIIALSIAMTGFNFKVKTAIKAACSQQQIGLPKKANDRSGWQKKIDCTAGWVAALSFYDLDDAKAVMNDLSDENALEVLKSPVWEQDLPRKHPNYPKNSRATSVKHLRHVLFNALSHEKQLRLIRTIFTMKSDDSRKLFMDLAEGVLLGDAMGNLALPDGKSSKNNDLIELLKQLTPEQRQAILTLDFCKSMVNLAPVDCGEILTLFATHHLDNIIATAEPKNLLKIALAKNCPAKISAHVSADRDLSKQILPHSDTYLLRTKGDTIFMLFSEMPSHLISEVFKDFSDEQMAEVLLAPNCPQNIMKSIISDEERVTCIVAALLEPTADIHRKLRDDWSLGKSEHQRLVFQKAQASHIFFIIPLDKVVVALSKVSQQDASGFLRCPNGEQFVVEASQTPSEFKLALKSIPEEHLAPCLSAMLKVTALNVVLETFLDDNPDYKYALVKLEPNHLIELLNSDEEICPKLSQFLFTNPIAYLTDNGLEKILELRTKIEQRIKEKNTTPVAESSGETIEDIKLERIYSILKKIDATSFLSLCSNRPIPSVVEYLQHPKCPPSHKEAAKSSVDIATLLNKAEPSDGTFDALITALQQHLIDSEVIMTYMVKHSFSLFTYLSKNEKHSALTVHLFKSVATKLIETNPDHLVPFIVSAATHPDVQPLAIKAFHRIESSESEETRGQTTRKITKTINAILRPKSKEERKQYIASIGELGIEYQKALISSVKQNTSEKVIQNMRDMFDDEHSKLLTKRQEELAS